MADPLNADGLGEEVDTSPISDEPQKFKDPLTSNVDSDDAELESLDLDTSAHSEVNISRSSSLIAAFKLEDECDVETRDLFVVVDNPEKHTGTMDSYITFRCTTRTTRSEYDTHEYCVRRRYNDFLWLRQKLEESHPTHLVPPLPEKHSLKRLDRFSPEFIRVRQRALQKFLTRIADHPVLSFNTHFQVFLTAKAWEFAAHKKQGSGLISRVADSLHNMGAAYMMKSRQPEFTAMQEYILTFSDKLGVLERISQRIVKEQTDYLMDLYSWGPVYTLWSNSEEKLTPALLSMSHTLEKCSAALKDLIDSTDDCLTQPLKEYILYTEAVKTVLRRRDAIQMEYDMTVEELNKRKDERELLKISDQTYSFGAFLGKDPEDVKQQKQEKLEQQILDLTTQMEQLNDKTVIANADLKADMERWHKNKRRDMKELFMATCDREIKYYETCLTAWENAIRTMQAPDPMIVEKQEAVDSGHGSID
ncbi:sorting nexin-30-like [Liolophura sinensis]|uniref:sorting nexin-30-like n=1 Tax=Liolophura sinensis TaxID=3198878 RepID=UPI003158E6B0